MAARLRAPLSLAALKEDVRRSVETLRKHQREPDRFCRIEWCSPDSTMANTLSVQEFLDLTDAPAGAYAFRFWEDGISDTQPPSHQAEGVRHEIDPRAERSSGSATDAARAHGLTLNNMAAELARMSGRLEREEERADRERALRREAEDERDALKLRVAELEEEGDEIGELFQGLAEALGIVPQGDPAQDAQFQAVRTVVETVKRNPAVRLALEAAGAGPALALLGAGGA